jgi:2-oxoglutarate dehydrogenase E2 component (dihydrolipoamide succinyltransferase)
MTVLTGLRKELGEEFFKVHGARLGFMSAFVRASVMSLQKYPVVNASIEGKEIVYHDYMDISVAVSAPRGLLVPVLRNCEALSFADIEKVSCGFYLVEYRRSWKKSKGREDSIGRNGWWHLYHH